MMARGLLLILLATYALASPITREENDSPVNSPPTSAVVKTEEVVPEIDTPVQLEPEVKEDEETADATTPIPIDDIVVEKDQESTKEQEVLSEKEVVEAVEKDILTAEIQNDEPVQKTHDEEIPAVTEESTVAEESAAEENSVVAEDIVEEQEVKKTVEAVSEQGNEAPIAAKSDNSDIQQDSSSLDDKSAGEEVTSKPIVQVISADEEVITEIPAVEAEVIGSSDKIQEAITVSPTGEEDDTLEVKAAAEEEQAITDKPSIDLFTENSEVVTETEQPISANFRNENIDAEGVTTETEEIAVTTDETISESPVDRADTATDTYFEDVTEIPEEIEAAPSNTRLSQADTSETSDVEVEETSSTDSPAQKRVDEQEITTETTKEGSEVDQIFEDAAPIAVVEIQQDESADDVDLHEDSAPIEIVEIVEKSELGYVEAESAVTEKGAGIEDVPESTVENLEGAPEDNVLKSEESQGKKADNKKKIQRPQIEDNKPIASKVQPSDSNDEYWLKMQQEADATKKSETSNQSDDEESEDISSTSAPEVEAASDVDTELEESSSSDKSDSVVVTNEDLTKEDPIYQGSESRNQFQESNNLERRLSFGDKVVRYARSHW